MYRKGDVINDTSYAGEGGDPGSAQHQQSKIWNSRQTEWIRWTGNVMRLNDNRRMRAVSEFIPRNVSATSTRNRAKWTYCITALLTLELADSGPSLADWQTHILLNNLESAHGEVLSFLTTVQIWRGTEVWLQASGQCFESQRTPLLNSFQNEVFETDFGNFCRESCLHCDQCFMTVRIVWKKENSIN